MKFTQLMTFVLTSLCVGFNAGIYAASGEHSRPMTDADALKHFAERFKTDCSASAGLTPISESDHVSTLLRLQHGLGQHICANNDRLFYRGYGERTRQYEMGRGITAFNFITDIDDAIKRPMGTLQRAASTFETAEQGAHCTQTLQQSSWYQTCLEGQKEQVKKTNATLKKLASPDYLQNTREDALPALPGELHKLFISNQYHAQKCINTLEYNTTPKPAFMKSMLPKSFLNPVLAPLFLVATKACERISHKQLCLPGWIKLAAGVHFVSSVRHNYKNYQQQVQRYNTIRNETNRY